MKSMVNTSAGFRLQFRIHMKALQNKEPGKAAQPFGYYLKTYPNEVRAMLTDLMDYLPQGETFEYRLNLTKRCYITDKGICK